MDQEQSAQDVALGTGAGRGIGRAIAIALDLAATVEALGGGRVINIASTDGKMGSMFQSPCNASKHALVGVTTSLALDLALDNVLVNTVCPGFTETQFAADALEHFAGASGQSVESSGRCWQ